MTHLATPYFAIITHDREGDEVQWQHTLGDDDVLDCDVYAKMYADEIGIDLDLSDGYVPNGCADFTVTLTDQPGGVICWSLKSYFFKGE